jgi:hypothetical protein
MKQTFFFLKTLFLKPTVSAIIFLVTIVLGFGVYAAISSLDEVKSTAAPANQLTAEKWDYLVDQVQQLEGARNTIVSQLQTIDTQIASIHQHLANLSGSATPSPLSNVWKVSGTTIYYTSGNVGIGTTNPTTKLYVNGSGYFNGNI